MNRIKSKSVKSLNPRLSAGQVCKSVFQTGYDIVRARGGEIKVETKVGEGTMFTITI